MSHASTKLPLLAPVELFPKKIMSRNAICWCGSGKKWKKCHRNRENEPPINFNEKYLKHFREFSQGYCSYPDAGGGKCTDKPVRAHTVQRRGGIEAIAENGHVISAKSAGQNLLKNKGQFVPSMVGVRSASTFPGFCNFHDTEMFRPIETGLVEIDQLTCFLLSFRAVSFEYFQKVAALRAAEHLRDADAGRPFEEQCVVQENLNWYIEGLRRGLSDTKRSKDLHDQIFVEKNFENYKFFAIECTQIHPVVGCGGFLPEFDFQGNTLQRISHGEDYFEQVSLNIAVVNKRSVIVFGCAEEIEGPSTEFIRSFGKLESADLIEAAVRCAFEHIENIFFRPSWWNGLLDDERNHLPKRMRTGLPADMPERQSNCLLSDKFEFTKGMEVHNVYSTLQHNS